MGFTITNGEAERFLTHQGLITFMEKEDIPFKVKYRVTKLKKKLEGEIKAFIETKEEIIKKYSEKVNDKPVRTENGGYKVDKNFLDDLNEEINILSKEEIILGDGYEYLDIDFEDSKLESLTGNEMEMLMMLIREE